MGQPHYSVEVDKRHAEFQRLVRRSFLAIEPLNSDFGKAIDQWKRDQASQFYSRTAIRCLCAAIEATLFMFRKLAEQMAADSGVRFDVKEIEILTEQKKVVGSNGVETIRPRWLPFPDSLKESFRLFAKAGGAKIQIDYGSQGFSGLRQVFEVRNRLMHPKKPFDVEVTAQDMEYATAAFTWFCKAYLEVIDQCQAQIDPGQKGGLKSKGGQTPR